MSYSESDYICLIRKISELYEDKTKNPLQVYFQIKKMLAIYSKIPVYPSNVVQILESNDKPVNAELLEKGDFIYAETEKDCIAGIIKDKSETGTLKLGEICKLVEYRSKTMNLTELKNVYCVQEKKSVAAVKNEDSSVKSLNIVNSVSVSENNTNADTEKTDVSVVKEGESSNA